MDVRFSGLAWEDCQYWLVTDKGNLRRVNLLISDMRRSPFKGIGKPEPLKGDLSGWWSRRMTDEHRIVYRIEGAEDAQVLEIAACRFHY